METELIFDLGTPCTVFLEYILDSSKLNPEQFQVDTELATKLVSKCFTQSDGTPVTEEYLKSNRDYGLLISALFRVCMTPITEVIFKDLDSYDSLNQALRDSRLYQVGPQLVEVLPLTTLDITNISVAVAQSRLKRPLLDLLKHFYLINDKPVSSYKDVDYSTMTIIWSQINQLIQYTPKLRKSFVVRKEV